jgi:REP element-mobilizing transposase RayT
MIALKWGRHSCLPHAKGMNDPNPKLNKSRRRLPHWELNGATYFVTFRLLRGALSNIERQIVLNHLIEGVGKFYSLDIAVVMPDHCHLLIRPKPGFDLTRVMKGIKGVSARLINQSRGSSGAVWQDESQDRIIRDEKEGIEKARYILENPVRAGLVSKATDYPYFYRSI